MVGSMMKKKFLQRSLAAGAALAFGATAMPAMAQSYHFATNNFGTDPNFAYGPGNGAAAITSPTLQTNCQGISSFTCFGANPNSLPTVLRNGSGAPVSFSTLTAPSNALLLHPGSLAGSDAVVQFTASESVLHYVSGYFQRVDNTNNGNGVLASIFLTTAANVTSTVFSTLISNTTTAAQNFSFSQTLGAGDRLSFVVNNNGEYTYDSTAFQARIVAVPEAGTWAMMILGLGMVGGAMRSRRKPAVAARLA